REKCREGAGKIREICRKYNNVKNLEGIGKLLLIADSLESGQPSEVPAVAQEPFDVQKLRTTQYVDACYVVMNEAADELDRRGAEIERLTKLLQKEVAQRRGVCKPIICSPASSLEH